MLRHNSRQGIEEGTKLKLPSKQIVIWVFIGLVAFLPRFLFMLYFNKHDLESLFSNDGYVLLAEHWLGWKRLTSEFSLHRPGPGFAMVCAALFKIAGHPDYLWIRVFNIICSTLTVFLAGIWAAQISNRSLGVGTAILTALAPGLIFFSPFLQSETFFIFLQMTFFLWVATGPIKMGKGKAFGMGVFGGLMTLTRGVFIIFLPFFIGSLWMRTQKKWGESIFLIFILLGWLVPISGWTIYNWLHYHKFLPITVQSGFMLYLGPALDRDEEWTRRMAMQAEQDRLGLTGYIDQDKRFRQMAMEEIRRQPGAYLKAIVRKPFVFWRPFPYPPYPVWSRWVLGLYYSLIFLLAGLGMWASREKIVSLLPVYAFFLSLTLTHTFMYSSLRYRIPLEPFLSFFASFGLVFIFHRVFDRIKLTSRCSEASS